MRVQAVYRLPTARLPSLWGASESPSKGTIGEEPSCCIEPETIWSQMSPSLFLNLELHILVGAAGLGQRHAGVVSTERGRSPSHPKALSRAVPRTSVASHQQLRYTIFGTLGSTLF